jgi:hypothetical protein
MADTKHERWPAIPVAGWQDTRDTLHLYTQVLGKIRLANEPLANHWWNTTLYLTARGLSTALMPHPTGPAFQIELDVVASRLVVTTVDGGERSLPLVARPVAEFYAEVMGVLAELGVATAIWPVPVEIPGAIPFAADQVHASYDAAAVERFWRALVAIQAVFLRFGSRFVGKASPVHYFWGAIDLAYTRFSGRKAPPHPGGAPNCGPHVMLEAYSQEVSSCGYWPGGPGEEGSFYAYAYPDPPGYREATVGPAGARWDDGLGEFVLPYELVRTAPSPEETLLEFLQSTYEAAATTARWDRAALDRHGSPPATSARWSPPAP